MKITPLMLLVGGAAAVGVYMLTRPSASAPPAAGGGFTPFPAPGQVGPQAPARSERDRLAQEGQALLNAAQNPATVNKAQLLSKAAELRRVGEPELASLLESTANRLPV